MNLVAWDLECSSLNADYGVILCAGFKSIGKPGVEVISISDFPGYAKEPTNDKELCKAIAKRLMEADVWVTWYGTYFDIPFINSRLLFWKLPTLPVPFPHIDGWKTARNRLKLRNNRLNTVQDFLQLKTEKDAVKGPVWVRAIAGHRPSLQYVIDHCKKDVKVLEEAYYRLRPLIGDHPNASLLKDGKCPLCAANRLQKRGFHLTRTRKYQRLQCQECGGWTKDPKPVAVSRLATAASV